MFATNGILTILNECSEFQNYFINNLGDEKNRKVKSYLNIIGLYRFFFA